MDNFTGSYHVESVEIVKQDKNWLKDTKLNWTLYIIYKNAFYILLVKRILYSMPIIIKINFFTVDVNDGNKMRRRKEKLLLLKNYFYKREIIILRKTVSLEE